MNNPAIHYLLWEAGLQFLAVLLAGMILGLFASVYLKKRDEVTRVAGVILEKRVNSHQEILAFFEEATYTLQVPSDRASPVHELIQSYGLEAPWGAKDFSLMSNGFWSCDSRKLLKLLSNKTLLGEIREVRTDNEDAKRSF